MSRHLRFGFFVLTIITITTPQVFAMLRAARVARPAAHAVLGDVPAAVPAVVAAAARGRGSVAVAKTPVTRPVSRGFHSTPAAAGWKENLDAVVGPPVEALAGSSNPYLRNIVMKPAEHIFTAGKNMDDLLRTVQKLEKQGHSPVFNVLFASETPKTLTEAKKSYEATRDLITELGKRGGGHVAIKLTVFAQKSDRAYAMKYALKTIKHAKKHNVTVGVDAEYAHLLGDTFKVVQDAAKAGNRNAYVVMQAGLYERAQITKWMEKLAEARVQGVRIVKGAPAYGEYVVKGDDALKDQFLWAASEAERLGLKVYYATHDQKLIESMKRRKKTAQHQMLYGMHHGAEAGTEAYLPWGPKAGDYIKRRVENRDDRIYAYGAMAAGVQVKARETFAKQRGALSALFGRDRR